RWRLHRHHSALLVHHGDTYTMIDCGADWLGRLRAIAPTAILLTHALPDHAAGLIEGAPCLEVITKLHPGESLLSLTIEKEGLTHTRMWPAYTGCPLVLNLYRYADGLIADFSLYQSRRNAPTPTIPVGRRASRDL